MQRWAAGYARHSVQKKCGAVAFLFETMMGTEVKRKTEQQSQWDGVFNKVPDFFGHGPSEFGRVSLEIFKKEGVRSVLELGCGQGRDTFLFAQSGLEVTALDYSESAVAKITEKANNLGFFTHLRSQAHDVREPLPYPDESFDACFSHMLLCMELSTDEIGFILQEVHRILSPGGIAIYSVRSNFDKHFGTGIHLGGDIYEFGDFVIHFFTVEKIHKLSRGYDILNIDRKEEGSLPFGLPFHFPCSSFFCGTSRDPGSGHCHPG